MTNPPLFFAHKKVQVVMTIENGQVIDTRNVLDNELIASMDTFLCMAKKFGYKVIPPEDETAQVTATKDATEPQYAPLCKTHRDRTEEG
ncbi:hypothetical protein Q6W85_004997 [Salmonella enterica]|nr:hypothetical protein [Salmonella enterica]ELK9790704.1 hypothetical protein [Salmonella enterica]ELK9829753.1 hypothetical protein [Salmonella enterica]